MGQHSNLRDVLVLFFRDDITAWYARRSGRGMPGSAALQPAQLGKLAAANAGKTLERIMQVHKSPMSAAKFQERTCACAPIRVWPACNCRIAS